MGPNQSPTLFMAALLLFAAAAPLAHAELPLLSQPLPLLNVATVTGSVCCSPNGHCPDGPPLAGVRVSLVCLTADGGGTVTLGEDLTGSNGAYLITAKNSTNTALGAVPAVIGKKVRCLTAVSLPQLNCPALSTATGYLVSAPKLVNVVNSPVNGVVGCFLDTLRGFAEVVVDALDLEGIDVSFIH